MILCMAYAWHDFNDLWDYGDPAASEATFRVILAKAEGKRDLEYVLQLKTQIARTYSLRGKFGQAQCRKDEDLRKGHKFC